MDQPIAQDTSLFFFSVALGFFFGLYYELFRFLRIAVPHASFPVFLEDLAFFLPVTGVFLLFTFAFSDGAPRWFSVAGVWAGFFLYLGTLGRLLSFFARQILRAIRWVLKRLFGIFVAPVARVLKNVTISLFTRSKKAVIIIREKRARARLCRQANALIRQAGRGFSRTVRSKP